MEPEPEPEGEEGCPPAAGDVDAANMGEASFEELLKKVLVDARQTLFEGASSVLEAQAFPSAFDQVGQRARRLLQSQGPAKEKLVDDLLPPVYSNK